MAQCPQCADSTLVHAMLTENLAGYSCGKCLGTLVSLAAYRAWRESTGRDRLPTTAAAIADTSAADSIAAKKCPKCRSLMSKYRIRAEQTNRLDYCPHCDEVWLDDGEWSLVEGLALSGDFTRLFTQAWQNTVKTEVTEAMEAERLRSLLGSDYARVEEMLAWLQGHPRRLEILAILSRSRATTENAAQRAASVQKQITLL
jgi:Zn-finger nucleic acid-binding protein